MILKTSAVVSALGSSGIDIEHLASLPCHVYWKNKMGTYLGYNDYGAKRLGFSAGKEVAHHSDFEIFPQTVATEFVKNDQQAMRQRKQIFFNETGVLRKNLQVIFLSYKMPIFDSNESVIGILGLSFTRAPEKQCASAQLEHDFNYYPAAQQKNKSLSQMENACMRYLCKGLTAKQIARRLNLSPRTVETYIERAKIKYNCRNKAELMWAIVNKLSTENS